MPSASEVFANFQGVVNDVAELNTAIETLYKRRLARRSSLYAFRGVGDADWGFHSSLYRRLWWTKARVGGTPVASTDPPTESELGRAEFEILVRAHQWGLHDAERGRLSVLRQLAVLQHNHAPTRLIDVSFNVWTALWFAVQPQWDNGIQQPDTTDGRLFMIDVARRLINETDERVWEDDPSRPWYIRSASGTPKLTADWTRDTRAWRPTPENRRIAAQQGAFLFGGVPDSKKLYPASTATNDWLSVQDARRCTSVPLRFHKFDAAAGGVASGSGNAAYTLRIAAALKPELRLRLERLSGLTPERIYPDIAGFGQFATQNLADEFPG
jgi:hypothetical protein